MTLRATPRRFAVGGALLVALAAATWGTDALFRRGLALELPSVEVVFWEHLVLALATLPLIVRARPALSALSRSDWIALAVVGGGSSVLATVLFTEAFKHGDPNTPVLLQKLQPLFAASGAALLLGERVRPRYFLFLAAGLAGSYLIAFGDPAHVSVAGMLPAVLGASAALLWAVGTVLGRKVVGRLDPMSLTAARFWLGLPVAAALFGLLEPGPAIGLGDVPAVLMLAAVPGLLGLMLYYRGLRDTPASVATVAELAFPLSALVVNRIAFDSTLTATQAIGTATLMTTVVAVAAVDRRRGADGLGVVYRRQASPARGVA